MKALRILARVLLALIVVWGLVALYYTLTRQPNRPPSFFWFVLPYPVLAVLTMVLVAECGRNSTPREKSFSWFVVGLASTASVGLAFAVSTVFFGIIHWAYSGDVSSEAETADPKLTAIIIAVSAACYIWAGAISAALSPQRPWPHALTSGAFLLLWSCAITLFVQPVTTSLMTVAIVAVAIPIPLAALGARLQQSRATQTMANKTMQPTR